VSGERRLRVLVVDDSEDDALLLLRELRRAGHALESQRVDTEEGMREALAGGGVELILSDYAMPHFSGPRALAVLHETGLDIPFIVVTGFVGEEQAASIMKAGAHDFLTKGRLFRLGPVVERELREAGERRERERAAAALRQKEQELLQAQKLEVVGRLAASIAHDFSNVLQVVQGWNGMLQQGLPPRDRLQEPVAGIHNAVERASGLVRRLMAFSRAEPVEPRVLELNPVLAGLETLLRRLLRQDIALELRLGEPLGLVRADPGQIEQVLINLVLNARDAMPHGGRILVETSTLASGVQISVADDGEGMSPEVRARIFEPFFTTKVRGKGTGLGLATVWGIVAQGGGRIEVDSEPGHGSVFRVLLPALPERPPRPDLLGGRGPQPPTDKAQ
jgi:signal transduction histidine kinase